MRIFSWMLTCLDAAVERPLLDLPLRMIFLCHWHRIHFAVIVAGAGVAGVGWLAGLPLLCWLGIVVALPSLACVALAFALAPLLVFADWATGRQRHREQSARSLIGQECPPYYLPDLVASLQDAQALRVEMRADGAFEVSCNAWGKKLPDGPVGAFGYEFHWLVLPSQSQSGSVVE